MDETPEDMLVTVLTKSGFKIVPLQAVVDALAQMEEFICEQTGVEQEDLDDYLERLEELVGHEETFRMELHEIIGWIKAFQAS